MWHTTSPWLYLLLNEDGTFITTNVNNWRKPYPFDEGQFRLEGTWLTFISSDESTLCAGQTGSYEVELTEEGQLQLVPQEEQCEDRRSGLPTVPWDRVPPITVENLTGTLWHIAMFATWLQLNEDGTYGFADSPLLLEEAPFDAGQFRLEGTSLTFITNDESEYCTGQTGSYEVGLTDEGQLQFELQEDPCFERRAGLPAGPWEPISP